MADTKVANTKTPQRSAGPHTPLVTPEKLAAESTGQWNFRNGSATPHPRPKS